MVRLSDDREHASRFFGWRLSRRGDNRAAAMGSGVYFVAALCIAALLASVASAQFRDPRRKTSVGFSVELPISAETLAAAVRRVASNGSIGGTFEYRGDSDVSGATLEASADALESGSPADGVSAFYKVRKNVLAPAHFPSSNDMGVITVRYEMEPAGAQRTVLRIDAVFVRDGSRAPYFSDGTVEASEYRRIQELLPTFSLLTHDVSKSPPAAAQPVTAPTAPPGEDQVTAPVLRAHVAAAVAPALSLENTLEEEKAQLAAVNSSVDQLQERARQLRFDTLGRVKFPRSPLKAAAYTESETLRVLDRGEEVTVLTTTRYWYRVRSADGREGWIYYMFLEPLS
jgi:hypothetical protein